MYAPLLKQIVIMILNFIYFHTNMNYYISVKGEQNMPQFEQLDLLLNEYGGTIQTFQVIDNGISKPIFYSYVKERGLEQAAHGVYVSPDTWTDAMYILHIRCSQAVFSHETALFFHDLTDREPLKYTITVRTGYNPSRLHDDKYIQLKRIYMKKGLRLCRHHLDILFLFMIWRERFVICYAAGKI
jgi:hypothetical protein